MRYGLSWYSTKSDPFRQYRKQPKGTEGEMNCIKRTALTACDSRTCSVGPGLVSDVTQFGR